MVSHILHLFGLPPDERLLSTLLAVIAGAGGGLATANVAANIFKSIPGLGTITGEVIAGITASTLTASLGNALISAIRNFRSKQARQTEFSTDDRKLLVDAFMEEYATYLGVNDD